MPSSAALKEQVYLARQLKDELLVLAAASREAEICGFLSGQGNHLIRCYPVSNVADDKRRFFLMDPQEQLNAMRQIEERGEELIAIYHSHIDSPAYPSATDLEWHAYPETIYVIMATSEPARSRMRGFLIHDKEIKELKLVVT